MKLKPLPTFAGVAVAVAIIVAVSLPKGAPPAAHGGGSTTSAAAPTRAVSTQPTGTTVKLTGSGHGQMIMSSGGGSESRAIAIGSDGWEWNVSSIGRVYVQVVLDDDGGSVTCEISVGGTVLSTKTSGGAFGAVSCSA